MLCRTVSQTLLIVIIKTILLSVVQLNVVAPQKWMEKKKNNERGLNSISTHLIKHFSSTN